jgi:hypothetical protein
MVCGDGIQSVLQSEIRIGYSRSTRGNLLNDKPTVRRLANKRDKMRQRISGSMITKLADNETSNRSTKVSRNRMDAVESDKRESHEVFPFLMVDFSSSCLMSSFNRIITPYHHFLLVLTVICQGIALLKCEEDGYSPIASCYHRDFAHLLSK